MEELRVAIITYTLFFSFGESKLKGGVYRVDLPMAGEKSYV